MSVQNSVVPALERALNIIEYLAERNDAVTVKQLSDDLDIPTASAFRLIKNMTARGYVTEYNGSQMTYVLGPKFMNLAFSYERRNSLNVVAKPIMQSLSSKLGQTVQLAVFKNDSVIYIDHAFSSAPLSIVYPLYEPISINVSASAKVILSLLPEEERAAAINNCSFVPLTDNTITNKEDFYKELEKCRRLGYGLDNEEFSMGLGCLARPIMGRNGECLGAIGVTGAIGEYRDSDRFKEMLDSLGAAASGISEALGLRPVN